MSGHTPGPWWRDDDGFVAAGTGDSYVTIADPHCSKLDPDEREANTDLIAAAPELLEALGELLAAFQDLRDGYPERELHRRPDEIVKLARAVLVKAGWRLDDEETHGMKGRMFFEEGPMGVVAVCTVRGHRVEGLGVDRVEAWMDLRIRIADLVLGDKDRFEEVQLLDRTITVAEDVI